MRCRSLRRTRKNPYHPFTRTKKKKEFLNKKVLITAGPTYEAIDPVRFIGNHSSGLMGFCIAHEIAERGGQVTLISGPTHLKTSHPAITRIDITSAQQMFESVCQYQPEAEIIIMAAAVADFTPITVSQQKIKKTQQCPIIELAPTTDILAHVGKLKKQNQILVGFALETNNEIENAKKKLHNKNLDFIVLNSMQDKGAGFKTETNKISIIKKDNTIKTFPLKSKQLVAIDIADNLLDIIN